MRFSRKELLLLGFIVGIAVTLIYVSSAGAGDISLNLGTEVLGAVLAFLGIDVILRRIRETEGQERQGFDYASFTNRAKRANTQIRILATSIDLLDKPKLESTRKRFKHYITRGLKDNEDLQIQLLFLDPYSNAAEQREKYFPGTIQSIKANLSELYFFVKELERDRELIDGHERLMIRLFDSLPPFQMFQIDDWGSISYFPRNRGANEANRFEFAMNIPIGSFMTQTFDEIWNDLENTKDINDYMCVTIKTNGFEKSVHFIKRDGEKTFFILLDFVEERELCTILRDSDEPIELCWNGQFYDFVCEPVYEDDDYSEVRSLASMKIGQEFPFDRIFRASQMERSFYND